MKAVIWAKVKCLNGRWHRVGLSKDGVVILPHHTALVGDPNATSATVMHGLGSPVRCVEVKAAWDKVKVDRITHPKGPLSTQANWALRSLPIAFQDASVFGIDIVGKKLAARPAKLKSKRATSAARHVKSLTTRIKRLTTALKGWKTKLKRYEKEGVEIQAPTKRAKPKLVHPASTPPTQATTMGAP